MLVILFALIGLLVCSCCCSSKTERRLLDGDTDENLKNLPFVYLQPMNGDVCNV